MVDKTAPDLAEQMKAIQSELLALSETVRSYTRDHASAGAEAVRDAASRAGSAAHDVAEEARRRGENLAEDLQGHITANPLPAVLVAAGIGLVIGAILGRR